MLCAGRSLPRRFRDGIGTFALDCVFALPQLEVGELLAFARQCETRRFHRVPLIVEVEDRYDSSLFHHVSIRVCGLVYHSRHFGAHLRPALWGDAAACLHMIAEWNRENRDGEDRDRCGEVSILAPSRMQCFFIELGFVELALCVRGFGLKILL